MSARVLGQYDLLVVEDETPTDQDLVYYVGPNVLALEKRFAFPPREFRLWLALHEVTHRAQFTGVPWMREYFLVARRSDARSVDPDPKRFVDALAEAAAGHARRSEPPRRRRPGGAARHARAARDARQDRRADEPARGPRRRHHGSRRQRASSRARPASAGCSAAAPAASGPAAKVLQRLIGLEAKLTQYEQGERFIAAVERAGGTELARPRAWEGPENLPTLAEIRDPSAAGSRRIAAVAVA